MTTPFSIPANDASVSSRCETMSWCGEKLSYGNVSQSTKCRTGKSSPAKKRISASSWSAWRGSVARQRTILCSLRASSAATNALLAPINRPHCMGAVASTGVGKESLNRFEWLTRFAGAVNGRELSHSLWAAVYVSLVGKANTKKNGNPKRAAVLEIYSVLAAWSRCF